MYVLVEISCSVLRQFGRTTIVVQSDVDQPPTKGTYLHPFTTSKDVQTRTSHESFLLKLQGIRLPLELQVPSPSGTSEVNILPLLSLCLHGHMRMECFLLRLKSLSLG